MNEIITDLTFHLTKLSFTWLDFFLFFLWLNFISFFILNSNLLNLLIVCELFWVILYIYFSILSVYLNSMIIFLTGIYILCIATSETTIGLSLLILKSNIFGSINNNNLINTGNSKNRLLPKISLVNSRIKKQWRM